MSIDPRVIMDRVENPFDRLAVSLLADCVDELQNEKREPAEILVDLDWLLDEGVMISSMLPGEFDGEGQVLDWLIARISPPVARAFWERLDRRRFRGELEQDEPAGNFT